MWGMSHICSLSLTVNFTHQSTNTLDSWERERVLHSTHNTQDFLPTCLPLTPQFATCFFFFFLNPRINNTIQLFFHNNDMAIFRGGLVWWIWLNSHQVSIIVLWNNYIHTFTVKSDNGWDVFKFGVKLLMYFLEH